MSLPNADDSHAPTGDKLSAVEIGLSIATVMGDLLSLRRGWKVMVWGFIAVPPVACGENWRLYGNQAYIGLLYRSYFRTVVCD